LRKPAPKAPFWPPPDSDRRLSACPRLRSSVRMRLSPGTVSIFA
jgi:hypothetical protein